MSEGGHNYVSASPSFRRRGMQRRLAAVLAADIKGYSLLIGDDEEDAHLRVNAAMDRLIREIARFEGRVFSHAGDGLMAEFPSAVEALKCALRVQADSARRNARVPDERRIEYRIGLNSGEILVQQGHTGGDAVNIAARLEQEGEPGGILLSRAVFEQVSRNVATQYEAMGARTLKNISHPVEVHRIPPAACAAWSGGPSPARRARAGVPTATADYRPSLAVLPLRTLHGGEIDPYFAEGMVDDIIRLLGGLKELIVIARSSTLGYSQAPLDLRRIGEELDVRYVLHGSVRRAGSALRIAVELSEADTGYVIWADRFDGQLSDVFELQDRIAMRVVAVIAPQLRERELGRAMRKEPATLTAYDLTLQALEQIYRMTPEAFGRAEALLAEAIAHDDNYAPAHSYFAYLRILLVGQEWSRDPVRDSALSGSAAARAIEIDPNDAMALALYGHSQSFFRGDFDTAMKFVERAVVAGPSCAWAWSLNSFTSGYIGRTEDAIARAEQAVRLSPIGPDAFWHEHALSQAHYLAGAYDQAILWGRMSAAHSARQTSNLRTLIASLVAVGEHGQARQVAAHVLSVAPGFRLSTFAARTPLRGAVREVFVARLRQAGLPD